MPVTITPIVIVGGSPVTWLGRAGPDHYELGDPYTASCHITRKPGDVAVVEGANATLLTKRDVDDLIFLLRRAGIRKVIWDRIRPNGSVHRAIFDAQRKN